MWRTEYGFREKIISFLDDTVRLKLVDLQHDIDLNSPEALCFFINIYHTLLIHARLVLSPPSTQVCFRTSVPAVLASLSSI